MYRNDIISLAHETTLAGHLGVTKTHDRIIQHFYWPKMKQDVSQFCKTCRTCQIVGKPNQVIPQVLLKPIPAFDEPFSRILIDCVGPLPKTRSGNEYLLTIMCMSTRFPEAIPLRKINASTIIKELIQFFTRVGLPKSIQSDQGSIFMSGVFQQVMHELGIEQFKSSVYHQESQGALERFHKMLKNMIRTYCFDSNKDWDEGVHLLLFAVRETVQESLGFSPFELVFGHPVRGPLKSLKEKWLEEKTEINLLEYVSKFKNRLTKALEIARENLKNAQGKMKVWYDKNARQRKFSPGDKVLVLFPISGQPLRARYYGPYVIERKLSEENYLVKTPGRRKQSQLCHINMIKEYYEREMNNEVKPVATSALIQEQIEDTDIETKIKLQNSNVLENLNAKLSHLPSDEQSELSQLILDYEHLFPDVPSRTDLVYHDVNVGDALPVKQHPYRVNPIKLEQLQKEVDYMFKNNIIKVSNSGWSSPCLLVPKPDNTYRFCTDYRKVNKLTKSDSYPIP